MKKFLFKSISILALAQKNPNPGYWQQHVDYKMEVNMDVKNSNIPENKKLCTPIIHQILYIGYFIICITMFFNQEAKWMPDFNQFLTQIKEWLKPLRKRKRRKRKSH